LVGDGGGHSLAGVQSERRARPRKSALRRLVRPVTAGSLVLLTVFVLIVFLRLILGVPSAIELAACILLLLLASWRWDFH